MPTLFKRYRTVLFYHRNLKLLEPPYFLMAEWMALKMVFATLCLGLVHFLYAQAGESGLLQVAPASYSYHMAQVFMCLLTSLCMSGTLYRLYQRKITPEQYSWITDVHPLLKLPAPVVEMTRLELALYVYRFYELNQADQDRYHPWQ
ncbi:hypothetical protein [Pseudomonas sp. PLMAX]|uniref:hypothetical protein n=1 Tax=Pseudomonas sp. PLMAX TaxID=2201998 RepID=UPI0038B9D40D